MKRTPLILLIILVSVPLLSCARTIRYSPSEISSYSYGMQEHIKKGEVALGMTPVQVRYSWGAPSAVRIPGADAEGRFREVWVYTKLRIFATRLVFTDGELTGIISGMARRKPIFESEPEKDSESPEAREEK